MTGAACGAGNAYMISPLVFIEVHVVLSFVSLISCYSLVILILIVPFV